MTYMTAFLQTDNNIITYWNFHFPRYSWSKLIHYYCEAHLHQSAQEHLIRGDLLGLPGPRRCLEKRRRRDHWGRFFPLGRLSPSMSALCWSAASRGKDLRKEVIVNNRFIWREKKITLRRVCKDKKYTNNSWEIKQRKKIFQPTHVHQWHIYGTMATTIVYGVWRMTGDKKQTNFNKEKETKGDRKVFGEVKEWAMGK